MMMRRGNLDDMTEEIEAWMSGGPPLLRVHEINVRTTGPHGLPTDLISLEVWEDGIRINFATSVLHDESGGLAVDPSWGWEVDDGCNSPFQWRAARSGGDGMRHYGSVSFAGTIADDAQELRLANAPLGIDTSVPLK